MGFPRTRITHKTATLRLRQLDHNKKILLEQRTHIITEIKRMEARLTELEASEHGAAVDLKEVYELQTALKQADQDFEETSGRWDRFGWEIDVLMAEISVGREED